MGRITEPKDVDIIIESPPLTDKERKEISKFIQQAKAKKRKHLTTAKKKRKDKKSKSAQKNQ